MTKKKPLISLVLLSVLCFSYKQTPEKPEQTVITNVNGYTFYNGALEEFSSIAFSDGKVVDVYSDTSFETSSNTKVIDGKGRTMLPGLIDAHAHVKIGRASCRKRGESTAQRDS